MAPTPGARDVVDRYFDAMRGNGDVTDVLAEDVVWHLPKTNPMGTPHIGRDAVLRMLGSGVDLYDPSGMTITVHDIVSDESKAAVRLTFTTRTAAGRDYEGNYHFFFECRDGRIVGVWESPDTLYQEQMGVFGR